MVKTFCSFWRQKLWKEPNVKVKKIVKVHRLNVNYYQRLCPKQRQQSRRYRFEFFGKKFQKSIFRKNVIAKIDRKYASHSDLFSYSHFTSFSQNNFDFNFYFAFWWRKSVISQKKCGLHNFFWGAVRFKCAKNNNLKVWEELHVSELDERCLGRTRRRGTGHKARSRWKEERIEPGECGPL